MRRRETSYRVCRALVKIPGLLAGITWEWLRDEVRRKARQG